MAEEKGFADLGKQLAELGITFDELKQRVKEIPEDKKRNILVGFANTILSSKPDDAFLAAKEANDDILMKTASRKLLEGNLRLASKVAMSSEDEDLMEIVIDEATRRGDSITAEIVRRHLKENRLRKISKEFGI